MVYYGVSPCHRKDSELVNLYQCVESVSIRFSVVNPD
jgi:hypothetical protein